MAELSLTQMLRVAGNRMSGDLREQLISHPGELGTEREEIVRSFLRSYLPKRFEVSTGFVFDSKGSLSEQLDIIIADSLVCPRFETVGGKRIYPCECVVGVGQVRSSMTSTMKLDQTLGNLQSVKMLDRSAGGKAVDERRQEPIDHRLNHLHQIFTFLFVIGNVLAAETVRERMIDYISDHDPHVWPNVIFALDRYLITYCCDDGICPNPMHARGLAVQRASEVQDILIRFYNLLGRAIEVTRVSRLPYWEYLNEVSPWDAEVFYSGKAEPPPLLSSSAARCHHCEGKGSRSCPKCNGRGRLNEGRISTATVQCRNCHGSGVVRCRVCVGKGWL